MKPKSLLLQALLLLGYAASVQAAPQLLSYSGHITVQGQAYEGGGQFKEQVVGDSAVEFVKTISIADFDGDGDNNLENECIHHHHTEYDFPTIMNNLGLYVLIF